METNGCVHKSEWSLIEEIARVVYEEQMSVLTKEDIKEIEDAIDEGHFYSVEEQEGGEMNFDTNSLFQIATLGFAGLQAAISYISWRYPNVINQNPNRSESGMDNDHHIDNNNDKDWVEEIIENSILSKDVKTELLKKKGAINKVINQKLLTLDRMTALPEGR